MPWEELEEAFAPQFSTTTGAPVSWRPLQWSNFPVTLTLAERLSAGASLADAFHFGPQLEAIHSKRELVEEALRHWPGTWIDQIDAKAPHEASLLNLLIDKAHHQLGWAPRCDFAPTVAHTVVWYRRVEEGETLALESCLADLVSLAATPTR
jgi:CDP-glucose 4,6-dehydratase